MTTSIAAALRLDGYWFEALRVCDERGWPHERAERLAHHLRYSGFREAIQPFLRAKSEFYWCKIPKLILHSDGRLEQIYVLNEVEKQLLAEVEEAILGVARSFGLTPPEGIQP